MLSTFFVRRTVLTIAAALCALAGGQARAASTVSPLRKLSPKDGAPAGGKAEISLAGCRNGSFSWQVVAGRGVRVKASDLKGPGGAVIPASAIQIRYATLDGPKGFFDCLEPTAAAGGDGPVWITVRVPKDAKPGEYAGKLTVGGAGTLSLKISVADWTLPDSKKFASFLDMVQSPESVALQYKVPMWSDRHWKLLEKTFELMGQLGCKVIYIPLLRRTDFGDNYSMVYWTKGPDGKLKHDLSVAEKYLDLAVKHLGKVPVVCLYAWHSETGGAYFGGAQHVKIENTGMPISIKQGGKFTDGHGPKWGTPEAREFWKPVFDGMRAALAKRGMAKSMMVGVATDMRPSKQAVEDLKAAAPGARWVVACHPFTQNIHGVPVGYLAHVWGITSTLQPGAKPKWGRDRAYGWKNPRIETAFPRYGCSIVGHSLRQWSALSCYRVVMEAAITSPGKVHRHRDGMFGKGLYGDGLRGVGRLGADFWTVLVDKRGRKKGALHLRYIKKGDHAVNLRYSAYYVLQPGKDGPIGSARMEAMREGIQEAEARIFIEKALTDPALKARLGADLAKRCQDLLDERIKALIKARSGAKGGKSGDPGWKWFEGSGWQGRSRKLYEAAGEVAGKLGAK